jgi:nitroimidazol reductase NimA-like FMN-containing flavoprotein (pyridoxamine 5'-phosphate oxidase superfamily)
MPDRQPAAEVLPSNADHAAPTPWAGARQRLADGQWYWLATVRPDRRPHVVPVLSVWLDGALYFVANRATRKARNLAHDPHCAVTVATDDAHLVVEGQAALVRDAARLHGVAAVYASKYDWHVTVRDGAFDADYGAPTAGPPPYDVYEVTPATAFAFGTDESFSPTRWRFSREGPPRP